MITMDRYVFQAGDMPNIQFDLEADAVSPFPDGLFGFFKGIGIFAIPGIRKVYFNDKHTTIEWEDGKRTTVGCIEGQPFDEYSGFAAAVLKRLFGSSKAAIRFLNEHKVVQPVKQKKKESAEQTNEQVSGNA